MNVKRYISMAMLIAPMLSIHLISQQAVVTTGSSKLRECDDLRCQKITELDAGDTCLILAVGKSEVIPRYGEHAWFKVRSGSSSGYIYGGLVRILNNPAREIPFDTSGYIRVENTNVRACASLNGCAVVFQIDKGTYCKILSKTKKKDRIDGLGESQWYFISANGNQGYVFGSLVSLSTASLSVDSLNVNVMEIPSTLGRVNTQVNKGDHFTIVEQSKKSELIRPYGRHYWYRIKENNNTLGWVFGAFTSKASAPVDCQCVDYVKNVLKITGSTKNALDWDQVLQQQIPVTRNGKEIFLDYYEINDPQKVRKGDIVIFSNFHPEANSQYGHIGIIGKKIESNKSGGRTNVPVIGGNHEVPLGYFTTEHRCNNVSRKNYLLNDDVRFFREKMELTDSRD